MANPTTNKAAESHLLPFDRLNVWTQFKFQLHNLQDDADPDDQDTVKAIPKSAGQPNGRFDTIIALQTDEAQSTGVEGTRIGRVRIIFRLPDKVVIGNGMQVASPAIWPKEPLAYIEWYQTLLPNPDKYHGMYVIRKRHSLHPQCSIIPTTNIRQSCMLFPNFGKESPPKEWKSDTVLDLAPSFFLNNWQSLYSYQSLW